MQKWTYKESRDLTGFIDGTENPRLSVAPEVVLIPEGPPAGAGGSVVLVQKWMHDAAAFDALSIEEQEKVILLLYNDKIVTTNACLHPWPLR